MNEIDFMLDENESVNCPHCAWNGIMGETTQKYVYTSPESWMSLAGREGYEYFCPKCGWMIKSNYYRMS